jgi:hypothetical protein
LAGLDGSDREGDVENGGGFGFGRDHDLLRPWC